MQARTNPVKPKRLGLIGRDHLASRLRPHGCKTESFAYKRVNGQTRGVPWVLEAAFGWCPEQRAAAAGLRRQLVGRDHQPVPRDRRHGRSLDKILPSSASPPPSRYWSPCTGLPAGRVHRSGQVGVVVRPIEPGCHGRRRRGPDREVDEAAQGRGAPRGARGQSARRMTAPGRVTIKDAAYGSCRRPTRRLSDGGKCRPGAPAHVRLPGDDPGTDRRDRWTTSISPDAAAGLHRREPARDGQLGRGVDARGSFVEPHTGKRWRSARCTSATTWRRSGNHKLGELDFDVRESRIPTVGPRHRFGGNPVHREGGVLAAVRGGPARRASRPAHHDHQGDVASRPPGTWSSVCGEPASRSWCCTTSTRAGFSIVGTLRRNTRRLPASAAATPPG